MKNGDLRVVSEPSGLCVWDFPMNGDVLEYASFDFVCKNELVVVIKEYVPPISRWERLLSLGATPEESGYIIMDRDFHVYYTTYTELRTSSSTL
jgi:hypothetical protein